MTTKYVYLGFLQPKQDLLPRLFGSKKCLLLREESTCTRLKTLKI